MMLLSVNLHPPFLAKTIIAEQHNTTTWRIKSVDWWWNVVSKDNGVANHESAQLSALTCDRMATCFPAKQNYVIVPEQFASTIERLHEGEKCICLIIFALKFDTKA